MPDPSPKVQLAGTASLALLLGLGAGMVFQGGELGASEGVVTVTVPGATQVGVTCGDTTTFQKGDAARILARPGACNLDVALSPVTFLKGTLEVSAPGDYRCVREEVTLRCEGPSTD
jgi:hypothetical protein